MTALVTLTKISNVEAWEGDGFVVSFNNSNYSVVVMNTYNGYERTMYCEEDGTYCDSDFCVRFVNGMPVLELFYGDESSIDDSEEERAADHQLNQDAM